MKYILIALIGILVSCKTSETSQTSTLVAANETWLNEPSFEINCTVAFPFVTNALSQIANSNMLGAGNTVNRINLQGRGDFLRISDNKVLADISYYGEQRFGSANANNIGIVLNDAIEDYEVSYNQKKKRTHIYFKATHEMEHYEFHITVYPSGNCDMNVNSSKRTFIKYEGDLKEFVIKE